MNRPSKKVQHPVHARQFNNAGGQLVGPIEYTVPRRAAGFGNAHQLRSKYKQDGSRK